MGSDAVLGVEPERPEGLAATTKVGGPLPRLRARLAGRADSEHEMSVNRFVFLVLMMIYLWARPVPDQNSALVAMGCGFVLTLGIFAHIVWKPVASGIRRSIALCADLSTISVMMYFGDSAGTIFYPLLLWTVLGNGFRFGIPWLAGSGIVAVVLFLSVIVASPFWRANPFLSGGLTVGLIIIPAYAAVLIRKLNEARQIAERASAAKTMFLATVSHQLRTPLNAIRGAHYTLLEGALTPDQREMVGIARDGTEILLSTVEELIDFSEVESGHLRHNPVTFELLPLLDEVMTIARTLVHEKPVRLVLHVDARCPLRLRGEQRYLRDILHNLISNAVKFTLEGGVLLTVRPLEIAAGTCRVECEVIDTGIGIEPEALDHIFESFTQANERILDEFGGTGLGLAICRRLASALSGSVSVSSVVGEGTTFRVDVLFELPSSVASVPQNAEERGRLTVIDGTGGSFGARLRRIAPDQAASLDFSVESRAGVVSLVVQSSPEALHAQDSSESPIIYYGSLPMAPSRDARLGELRWCCASRLDLDFTREDWMAAVAISRFPLEAMSDRGAVVLPFRAKSRGMRALIADDNKLNQRVIGKVLETAGYDVVLAGNGDDALEIMDSGTINIVLMDVNMPVLNGLEATKHYRVSALDLAHLPIIGLTADATPRMAQRCLEAGMDACLTKPIDARRLLSVMDQFVGKAGDSVPMLSEPAEIVTLPTGEANESSLDETRLRELEELGGTGFLHEVLNSLISDVDTLTNDLQQARGQKDLYLFRDLAHSIRSCAANLGAISLCRQAERLECLPAEKFARDDATELCGLVEQATRLKHDIRRRLAH
jgi:two-component system, sensor histidine kinase RpfC